MAKPKKKQNSKSLLKARCGLCGKTRNLIKTECCGNWICDDEHKYVLFSYAHNSCSRNHQRYTLCGFHRMEAHKGDWENCPDCKVFETEMYVWYGTNEYNFEKLQDPPAYEPTRCSRCKAVINLGEDAYSIKYRKTGSEYWCDRCFRNDRAGSSRQITRRGRQRRRMNPQNGGD